MSGSPYSDPFSSSIEFTAVGGSYNSGHIINDPSGMLHEFQNVGASVGRAGEIVEITQVVLTTTDEFVYDAPSVGGLALVLFSGGIPPTATFANDAAINLLFTEAKNMFALVIGGNRVPIDQTGINTTLGYQLENFSLSRPSPIKLQPSETSLYGVLISFISGPNLATVISIPSEFQITLNGVRLGGVS